MMHFSFYTKIKERLGNNINHNALQFAIVNMVGMPLFMFPAILTPELYLKELIEVYDVRN